LSREEVGVSRPREERKTIYKKEPKNMFPGCGPKENHGKPRGERKRPKKGNENQKNRKQ